MQRNRYLVLAALAFLCTAPLVGCSHVILFDPKGPVGDAERTIIIVAVALMLIVVIPVHVMVLLFSRKYRASNTEATYAPRWYYFVKIDLLIWLVPVAIVSVLGILAWRETHRLNPYKPIDSSVSPVRIEAVSLDWKWLFIYPDHHIASVMSAQNSLTIPSLYKGR